MKENFNIMTELLDIDLKEMKNLFELKIDFIFIN